MLSDPAQMTSLSSGLLGSNAALRLGYPLHFWIEVGGATPRTDPIDPSNNPGTLDVR